MLDRPGLEPHPGFTVYEYARSTDPTEAPEHTIGAFLERALRMDGEGSLASQLANDAQRLVSLVEDEIRRRRGQAITLNDQAIARWRQGQ